MDMKVCDEVIPVPNDVCFKESREFARSEGMIVGISAGAALWAGLKIAGREEARGKTIVVLLPDSGDRYLSANLFV
jgi:cysteine synthase A